MSIFSKTDKKATKEVKRHDKKAIPLSDMPNNLHRRKAHQRHRQHLYKHIQMQTKQETYTREKINSRHDITFKPTHIR